MDGVCFNRSTGLDILIKGTKVKCHLFCPKCLQVQSCVGERISTGKCRPIYQNLHFTIYCLLISDSTTDSTPYLSADTVTPWINRSQLLYTSSFVFMRSRRVLCWATGHSPPAVIYLLGSDCHTAPWTGLAQHYPRCLRLFTNDFIVGMYSGPSSALARTGPLSITALCICSRSGP